MNAVDIIIVIAAPSAIAVGVRVGLWRQLGLSAGIIIGCFAAGLLQVALGLIMSKTLGALYNNGIVFWLLLAACLLIVFLATDIGWALGGLLHNHASRLWKRPLEQWLSKAVSALIAGLVAVTGVWLLSVMLLKNPVRAIRYSVQHSIVLGSLTHKLPAAPALFMRASNLINPHALPNVFLAHDPLIGAQVPDAKLSAAEYSAITQLTSSALPVVGNGCGGTVLGSSFVVADNLVITNAHVVSGLKSSAIIVEDAGVRHAAVPVYFDPALDIALLRVDGLAAKPMPLESVRSWHFGAGAALGYSSGGLLTSPVTITGRRDATGYDIYNQNVVIRNIYAFRGRIEKGDSGGPLVDSGGKVIGVTFAKSEDHANTGYALDINEVTNALVGALSNRQEVATGECGAE